MIQYQQKITNLIYLLVAVLILGTTIYAAEAPTPKAKVVIFTQKKEEAALENFIRNNNERLEPTIVSVSNDTSELNKEEYVQQVLQRIKNIHLDQQHAIIWHLGALGNSVNEESKKKDQHAYLVFLASLMNFHVLKTSKLYFLIDAQKYDDKTEENVVEFIRIHQTESDPQRNWIGYLLNTGLKDPNKEDDKYNKTNFQKYQWLTTANIGSNLQKELIKQQIDKDAFCNFCMKKTDQLDDVVAWMQDNHTKLILVYYQKNDETPAQHLLDITFERHIQPNIEVNCCYTGGDGSSIKDIYCMMHENRLASIVEAFKKQGLQDRIYMIQALSLRLLGQQPGDELHSYYNAILACKVSIKGTDIPLFDPHKMILFVSSTTQQDCTNYALQRVEAWAKCYTKKYIKAQQWYLATIADIGTRKALDSKGAYVYRHVFTPVVFSRYLKENKECFPANKQKLRLYTASKNVSRLKKDFEKKHPTIELVLGSSADPNEKDMINGILIDYCSFKSQPEVFMQIASSIDWTQKEINKDTIYFFDSKNDLNSLLDELKKAKKTGLPADNDIVKLIDCALAKNEDSGDVLVPMALNVQQYISNNKSPAQFYKKMRQQIFYRNWLSTKEIQLHKQSDKTTILLYQRQGTQTAVHCLNNLFRGYFKHVPFQQGRYYTIQDNPYNYFIVKQNSKGNHQLPWKLDKQKVKHLITFKDTSTNGNIDKYVEQVVKILEINPQHIGFYFTDDNNIDAMVNNHIGKGGKQQKIFDIIKHEQNRNKRLFTPKTIKNHLFASPIDERKLEVKVGILVLTNRQASFEQLENKNKDTAHIEIMDVSQKQHPLNTSQQHIVALDFTQVAFKQDPSKQECEQFYQNTLRPLLDILAFKNSFNNIYLLLPENYNQNEVNFFFKKIAEYIQKSNLFAPRYFALFLNSIKEKQARWLKDKNPIAQNIIKEIRQQTIQQAMFKQFKMTETELNEIKDKKIVCILQNNKTSGIGDFFSTCLPKHLLGHMQSGHYYTSNNPNLTHQVYIPINVVNANDVAQVRNQLQAKDVDIQDINIGYMVTLVPEQLAEGTHKDIFNTYLRAIDALPKEIKNIQVFTLWGEEEQNIVKWGVHWRDNGARHTKELGNKIVTEDEEYDDRLASRRIFDEDTIIPEDLDNKLIYGKVPPKTILVIAQNEADAQKAIQQINGIQNVVLKYKPCNEFQAYTHDSKNLTFAVACIDTFYGNINAISDHYDHKIDSLQIALGNIHACASNNKVEKKSAINRVEVLFRALYILYKQHKALFKALAPSMRIYYTDDAQGQGLTALIQWFGHGNTPFLTFLRTYFFKYNHAKTHVWYTMQDTYHRADISHKDLFVEDKKIPRYKPVHIQRAIIICKPSYQTDDYDKHMVNQYNGEREIEKEENDLPCKRFIDENAKCCYYVTTPRHFSQAMKHASKEYGGVLCPLFNMGEIPHNDVKQRAIIQRFVTNVTRICRRYGIPNPYLEHSMRWTVKNAKSIKSQQFEYLLDETKEWVKKFVQATLIKRNQSSRTSNELNFAPNFPVEIKSGEPSESNIDRTFLDKILLTNNQFILLEDFCLSDTTWSKENKLALVLFLGIIVILLEAANVRKRIPKNWPKIRKAVIGEEFCKPRDYTTFPI